VAGSGKVNKSSQLQQAKKKWLDISVPIQEGMVNWPGDEPVQIKNTHSLEKGDSNNLTSLSMGSHTGTHMDAPLHFILKEKGIDELPFDVTIGRARVIEIEDQESIKPGELSKHKIRSGERILFKTCNSTHNWSTEDFKEDFVHISVKGARFLAACGVKLIGVACLKPEYGLSKAWTFQMCNRGSMI